MVALIENSRVNDADLVRLIEDGRILLGAYGAPAPTGTSWDPSSVLASGTYTDLGYYSDSGFTLTPEPGDNTQVKAHNKDVVIDQDEDGTWAAQFTGIQQGRKQAETYFDAAIDSATGQMTVTRASVRTWRSLILVGNYGSGEDIIVVHAGRVKVSDRDAITFGPGDVNSYGMTLRMFKDPTLGYQFRAWSTLWVDAVPAAPTIAAALPEAQQEPGGLVTITGTGFSGASLVKFGATAAPWFQVDSDTQIRTIMPAGSAGTANIYVTTPGGVTDGFSYARAAAE